MGRHEALQLLEPVEDDIDVRRGSIFLASVHHHETLAVRRNVVIAKIGSPRKWAGEKRMGSTGAERWLSAHLDCHELIGVAEEELPTAAIPHRLQSAINRNRVLLTRTGKRSYVHFESAGFIRHVGQPAAVRREGRGAFVGSSEPPPSALRANNSYPAAPRLLEM